MTDDPPNDDPEAEPRADAPLPDQARADDPATARRQRTKRAKAEDEARAFWTAVFADPVGRREMWGLLEAARWREDDFACGPTGFPYPEAAWFRLGEKRLAERVFMSWMKLARDGALLMLDEHDPRFADPKKRSRT